MAADVNDRVVQSQKAAKWIITELYRCLRLALGFWRPQVPHGSHWPLIYTAILRGISSFLRAKSVVLWKSGKAQLS